jgi:spore germination protein YaaH
VRAATPSPAPPADATHPYVMQRAAQQEATAKVTVQPATSAPRLMPAVGGAGGPLREIFGFALASSLADPSFGYPSWNFSLLSTVAFFGLHVQDDGNFAADSGMSVWNSSTLTNFVNTAHSNGTKVVVTIIQQDFDPGTPHMCAALAHTSTTIASTVNQIKAKGVDGVNIDYEGLNGSCGSADPSYARKAFTTFAGALHNAMPAGTYLSVDTYAGSASDPGGYFDIPGLAPVVDSMFVMAYDLEYANYYRPPLNCGSFCLGPTAPLTGYYYTDTNVTSQYLAVAPASKVILGVPYYGRKSCVGAGVGNAYPTSSVVADTYLDASGESTAAGVQYFAAHRDANDPPGLERWDTWLNTSMNCTRELYWDDTTSLAKKYDLINRNNLRGVGMWNLNYGGGAPELWATLSTYFACPVTINIAATQSTTQFSVPISAGSCAAQSFEMQEFDSTSNQGWFSLPTVAASNGAATALVDGFANHTYQIQVRARTASGVTGGWATATTQVAANATKSHPFTGVYLLDGWGGLNRADSPPLATTAYWQGWKIARAAHAQPGPNAPQAGFVLDGFGGMHQYGSGITSFTGGGYWQGWDIARDFAWLPNGTGGYLLDGFGGLHEFAVNGNPLPPQAQGGPYWQGWDIARKVVIFSDGTGGYVLDGWGGVHPFGVGRPNPPGPAITGYWMGWDIAHDLALIPGTHSGYVMEGFGGVHPFTPPGQPMPPSFSPAPYWQGWDIARGIFLLPSSTMTAPVGYLLDGFGGLNGLGTPPGIKVSPYWGWDIGVGITGA